MKYGICNLPVIPLREDISNKSEMISQVLFGESFEVLENSKEHLYIRLAHDGYQGWISAKQQQIIDEEIFIALQEPQQLSDISTLAMVLKLGKEENMHLLPGSVLPFLEDNTFKINEQEFLFLGLAREPVLSNFESEIAEVSQFYLNAPYLWGGRTLFGVDCSGFVQTVFRYFGINLRRDAWQQAEQGKQVDFIQEARLGDLAFFDNEEGRISHVGMMLSESEIIHASGRVKVDQIDYQGIYCAEENRYTHKLRIIKRLHG